MNIRRVAAQFVSILMMVPVAGTVAGVGSASASLGSTQQAGQAEGPPLTVYPAPGTTTVSPGSQLSFRGADLSSIPDLSVVGTESGPHQGHWLDHSDHDGASFLPDQPFAPGETVTVSTSRAVTGVTGGALRYQIARPAAGLPSSAPVADPSATPGSQGAAPAPGVAAPSPAGSVAQPQTPSGSSGPYRSRPDLHPPKINTTVGTGVAPGLLLATVPGGTIIYDNQGEPVWFKPTADLPRDLQKVTYKGQNALAYFVRQSAPFPGDFVGEVHVLDASYRQIGTIKAGNGYTMNEHDLQIGPRGQFALFPIWAPVTVDLSPYGGPTNATVLEGIVQEVDIATGAVTFEWHSLGSGDFPVTDSYIPLNGSPVDYMHLNSVEYDRDGNFLISARNVSAVAKLRKSDAHVMWRLGGRRNQFRFTDGDGGPSWSHDVRRRPDGAISVYDNGNSRTPPYGRGVAWSVDETNFTAHVAVQWRHHPDLFGSIYGSNRLLPNGNDLISWGDTGTTTEYASGDPTQAVFQSQLAAGGSTYRTERVDWHATPARPPDMAVDRSATTAAAYASWNGATEVATWQLWGGPDSQHLRLLGSAARSGFETRVPGPVQSTDRFFQVQALDSSSQTIGQSAVTPDAIQAKYQSVGGPRSFLGSPVGGENPIAGGLEQDYATGSIYWSSSTGAHEVHGSIWKHYQSLGGPASVLSFPTTDQTPTPDGVGRYNHFAGPPGWGGSIYWTDSTGAWEVHGAIRAKWASLGWERSVLGYPVSDETPTSDGIGSFNNFSGPPGWGGSIYFRPSTGVHEVHGAIRAYWSSQGKEKSRFGYPTTDEFTPFAGAAQSDFQNGYIRWTGSIQTG